MSKLSARKKRVKRNVEIGILAPEAVECVDPLDGRIAAIQLLIPLGLQAVTEELQQAVIDLAGERYQRKASDQPLRRWGSQRGSVYLGDQKLPIDVPRVRNVDDDTEVALHAYQALQTPRKMDEGLLLRMLKGIATRNYETCAEAVPEAFGLSSSTVSRRYVKATARKLAQFQERSLEGYDLVALFLDGKSFADEQIIIALGVTVDGQKIPLGFVQAATENERVCRRFLADLVDRGLQYEAGLLVVIDGAKGLYKAVMSVLKAHACVQRCQYHKRKNVVSYLPKCEQDRMRRKMEAAYSKPTYEAARKALAQARTGTDEPVCPQKSRGGHGRDAHVAPLGHDVDAQPILSYHQLHRERQQSLTTADPQRAALDEFFTASPLGGHGVARHRASPAQDQRLSPPADASTSTAN